MNRGVRLQLTAGDGDQILNIDHIDVYYGRFHVLWDISLKVERGQVVTVIGANGSGKSTLLSTIMGLVHPATGCIWLDGRRIDHCEPFEIVELGISMVPEGRRIFPELTVLENLTLGSYPRASRPEKAENLERVYKLFPVLRDRKNQIGATLSGGEQQMLAIGRAVMSRPKLLLFDEISLGLAPIIVDKLYSILEEINAQGITILFVEQNVARSLKKAKRACVLRSGQMVFDEGVENLTEQEVRTAYFGVA